MIRINQVKVRPGHSEAELKKRAAKVLQVPEGHIMALRILRRSVDARKKPELFYSYTLEAQVQEEEKVLRRFRGRENLVSRAEEVTYRFPDSGKKARKTPTVIVGAGPAGLFCCYFLALHGYRPLLLERGKCVEERRRDVEEFWETGRLDPASNVQFGEGGAGTFSDGKLNTLVKDGAGRNRAVLETFVRFGAKESILYEARPHLGTDVLCGVVRRMREEILRLGGRIRFGCRVTEISVEQGHVKGVILEGGEALACEQLVLAVGHSARDTFSMLWEKGIPMEAKAFAVGLRVEHPQSMINESQYGVADPGELGAASYRLAAGTSQGRGVYSFCMCPGGYVVNASSQEGYTAVNGMSYSGRDGENANSAVIVTVTPRDFGSDHPLAGVAFQRRLEEKAFALGGGKIPVQRYGDFKQRVESLGSAGQNSVDCSGQIEKDSCPSGREAEEAFSRAGQETEEALSRAGQETEEAFSRAGQAEEVCSPAVEPQCKGRYVWADLSRILPQECSRAFVEGMEVFGRQIKGFDRPDACLSGVESRTSSPVRIPRDESLQSSVRGLYPCGEGAGYAGGILSAAMDGMRVAEAIGAEYAP